ncbi:MAG TPA: hypothetical protein VIR33_01580 [Thermopolyspora sp.]|jgi:hypothetical protein
MGVAARIQESFYRWTGRAELAETLRAERLMVAHLQESLTDLEARMFEPGWQHMTALADTEFSRDGLRQITAVCRIMTLKNPLLSRGFSLRTAYIWGQGVQITGRAGRQRGKQDVNKVIQAFLDDPGNRRTFSGDQAREGLERSLFTDGNVFFALFTAPRTGRVQVRTLPWDEITEVITNPEDSSEPQFYRREWWYERRDPGTGAVIQERRITYYPALGHNPRVKPPRMSFPVYGDAQPAEVMWDAPVYHVKVGGHAGWKFGVPDCYAAIDWAQAYKSFLEDWARLVKALSRFAWRLTSKGSKQAAARTRIAAGPGTDRYTGEPQHAGATALLTPDMMLEAVPKSGATIDSDSGRPLAAMVAAAIDVPVTMLLGDPGTTGARATAETLDTPTERSMEMRRGVWTTATLMILDYVIDQAVKAPDGPLKGVVAFDEDGRQVITLRGSTDRTVDVSWPDLDDLPVETLIKAIVEADSTTYMPPLVVVRLLLQALKVQDVDQIIDSLTGDDGEFKSPHSGAGQVAADRFRRGEDPAQALGGHGDGEDDGHGRADQALQARESVGVDPDEGLVDEVEASRGGNAARLRRYWTSGKGAVKVDWASPGAYTRCIAELGAYVKDDHELHGLCANMYHEVNHRWPGAHHDKESG